MRTRAQVADPAGPDLAYLSTTYAFPEPDLQTLLDSPTSELVKRFLVGLMTKGLEFDALKADKLKADVELENNVRTSEAKLKAQKALVTKHAKELEHLRIKLNEAESARERLASELEQLRSSTSGSTAETQMLRQRIDTLEASNRDALALVESKSGEKDRLAVELSEQHSKLLALRRDVGHLEERNQSLENAASTQKFKEQSLQQEIDLLKKNNEWHNNELQTRTHEHAKFRKERNARIASLQRELEDSNAAVEALRRSETNLRQRLDEVQVKADEAFARIASLQEEAARKEQDFKTELNSSKRLAELQAQSAKTHKDRLQEVQGQIDQIKDDAAEEIGRLQAEIETERGDKEANERRVADLELEIERLQQQTRASRPATPMRNGPFDPSTPRRLGSRSDSPSTMLGSMRKTVNGLSFTQLYAQFTEKERELAAEKVRTNKLSTTLDELVTQLETQGPEVLAMKEEQEKLEQQVLDFSTMLDDANQTRDDAVREAHHWQNEAAAAAREGDILRQQLRDLSAQIKMLLVEAQSREQGLGDMTATERLELERAARGELEGSALEHMTDTGRFIAERLVIFHNVSDLQEKNQQMLRLVETLGDKLEGEEAQEKERQTEVYRSENEDLRQQVQRLKDELQATVTQIDSYMKERDMFRRMLQHRGQLPVSTTDGDLQGLFGRSMPPATPQRNEHNMVEAPTPRSRDVEDLNKLLKEQQTFFDQYRNESAEDRRMLKDQVDTLAREKSTLQTDLSRAQSQLALSLQRYEMLQSNFTALRSENMELSKRGRELSEQAAKQDLRTQQVAEELVEARSMTESLRNENANAKAERELWKRIEARLTDDNKSLMDERGRLNKLVNDLQNLQNERELAESEGRRRLQGRAETLEAELTEVKKKLDREVEEGRKLALRREYEEGQSRTRIDDLVKLLGNVREELVVAKTTRDQLQARVEEMKIELRSAEEKVVALHPRPTPRSVQTTAEEQQQQTNSETEDELPEEQRLALQISELRRDLELARNELEAARQEVEQYKSIAQTTEEELASMNDTTEQYKEDMDQLIAEKDAHAKELEQRLEDLNAELTTTNNEISDLRTRHDEATRALAEQKSASDRDLAQLRDDAERHAEEKKLYQADLKAQAAIAQQAQQSYEEELLKHAEVARALQGVRREYHDLRTEVAGLRAEAESAKASLEHGEESWAEQRERFETELAELRHRREDVDQQNALLHRQMEAFSDELAALRQGRRLSGVSAADDEEGVATVGSPSQGRAGDSGLQEVIKYLRREKEIVDVQYELTVQESKRLQQQLDYANSQLEESRAKLAEERRQAATQLAAEGSTNKLMQTINELNLFRESATTLRNEARAAREKLEEKSREVERLVAVIEPLKSRAAELEGELEAKEGEIKLLQDDRDHWRERTQNIISKYDRVDPAELESLKAQLDEIKAEKERLEGVQAEEASSFEGRVQSRIDEATKEKDERIARIISQAKDRDSKRTGEMRQLNEQLSATRTELAETKEELEESKMALAEAQVKAAAAAAAADDGSAEEGEVEEDDGENVAALYARIAEADKRTGESTARAEELQRRVEELDQMVTERNAQFEAAKQDAASAAGEQSAQTDDSETLEGLRQELATAKQEVEMLRTTTAASAYTNISSDQTMNEDGYTKSADQLVADAVARTRAEMQAQHDLAVQQLNDANQKKIDSLKTNLRRQLQEEREKYKQLGKEEVLAQHAIEMEKVKEEHEAEMRKLEEAHQADIQRLEENGGRATAAEVKAEREEHADKAPELTDAQVLDLLKTNQRARNVFKTNIDKQVGLQTEKLTKAIGEKDEEIAQLQAAIQDRSGSENTVAAVKDTEKKDLEKRIEELETEIRDLTSQLETLRAQKDELDRQIKVLKTEEMKTKVLRSQFPIAQGRIQIVSKAAQETPDKPVGEVWEIAKVFKPAPAAKPGAGGSVPATAGSGKQQEDSPSTAAGVPDKQQDSDPSIAPLHSQLSEAEKLRKRQQRFGMGGTAPSHQPTTFGQPSTAPLASTPGQPSEPAQGAIAQPPHRLSGQATSFFPGTAAAAPTSQTHAVIPASGVENGTNNTVTPSSSLPRPNNGTGPAALRSLSSSGIPRGGGSHLPRGGGAGGARGGGGGSSGLPRGGVAGGAGRGGGRGGGARGGGAGAGQKRPHDGGEGSGGDGKRVRGGGGAGGA